MQFQEAVGAGKIHVREVATLSPPCESGRSVIIDALAARYGGGAFSAIHIARGLARLESIETVVLVTRQGSILSDRLKDEPGVLLEELSPLRRGEIVRRLLWEAVGLPRLVCTHRATSVLSLSGMLPFPRHIRAPLVCFLSNPVVFQNRGRLNQVRRLVIRRTAREATRVLVPSMGMGMLAQKVLQLRPEIAPLGVDHGTFRPVGPPGEEVLCVADFYGHKRHEVLLKAWADLPGPRPVLRLIGDPRVDPRHYRRLQQGIRRFRQFGSIVVESGLSLAQLVAAYRRARLLALASDTESFCLPLLEAQASGVPPVVRDLPSLRETGGAGATYVGSDRTREWTRAIDHLLSDDAAHAAARIAAASNAKRFSWQHTAEILGARLLEG